jgi:hypothetical protein
VRPPGVLAANTDQVRREPRKLPPLVCARHRTSVTAPSPVMWYFASGMWRRAEDLIFGPLRVVLPSVQPLVDLVSGAGLGPRSGLGSQHDVDSKAIPKCPLYWLARRGSATVVFAPLTVHGPDWPCTQNRTNPKLSVKGAAPPAAHLAVVARLCSAGRDCKGLTRRISNTLKAAFCFVALHETIHKSAPPKNMNADQGTRFTPLAGQKA